MNKMDSLAFLNECLNRLANASDEDKEKYKELYKQTCSNDLISNHFEFCIPSSNDNVNLTIDTSSTSKVIEQNYLSSSLKNMNEFSFKITQAINKSDFHLVYAA